MLKVYDVDVNEDWEAGNTIKFHCPKCNDGVSVADSGRWSTKCSCGYKWRSVIYAYTEDDESEK